MLCRTHFSRKESTTKRKFHRLTYSTLGFMCRNNYRIIECLGWKRPKRSSTSNPPAMGRNTNTGLGCSNPCSNRLWKGTVGWKSCFFIVEGRYTCPLLLAAFLASLRVCFYISESGCKQLLPWSPPCQFCSCDPGQTHWRNTAGREFTT